MDQSEAGTSKGKDDVTLGPPAGATVCGTHSFQEVLNKLPKRLTKQTARNCSVPIAFVCLLHLANEKVKPSGSLFNFSYLHVFNIIYL